MLTTHSEIRNIPFKFATEDADVIGSVSPNDAFPKEFTKQVSTLKKFMRGWEKLSTRNRNENYRSKDWRMDRKSKHREDIDSVIDRSLGYMYN